MRGIAAMSLGSYSAGKLFRVFLRLAVAEAEFRLMELRRNKQYTIITLSWPYLMMLSIYILGTSYGSIDYYRHVTGVEDPLIFLAVASAVAFTAVGIIDYTSNSLLWHRWLGTLPYVILASPRFTVYLLASGTALTVFSVAINYVSIVPLILVLGGLDSFFRLMVIVAIVLLGMIPLMGIAIVASLLSIVAREEGNVLGFLNPLLLLLSGVFYPVELLPRILEWASKIIPVTYVVESAKLVSGFDAPGVKVIYIVLYAFALMSLLYNVGGVLALEYLEKVAQRRGVSS
ncbi:ABC transporter permease [Aeropyrum pernix]|nr:ABC transporter permease [Aeropyrum pernix]